MCKSEKGTTICVIFVCYIVFIYLQKKKRIQNIMDAIIIFQTKLSNDAVEVDVMDRPKTPQAPEPPVHREQPNLPPTLPFPFFPTFPTAPGLIPHPITHPIFPRFPLPLGRGGPGPHPAMPNLPLPPRFLNPTIKPEDFALSKIKPVECEKPPREIMPPIMKYDPIEKEKADKIKVVKQDKEIITHTPGNIIAPPIVSAPAAPIIPIAPVPVVPLLPSKKSKIDKADKVDKVTLILMCIKKKYI